MLIEIGVSARFEPLLALAESQASTFWLPIASRIGDLAADAQPDDLPAALAALPPEAFAHGEAEQTRQWAIARMGRFLEDFRARWIAGQGNYRAAAARLQARLADAGDAADIGSLFDFPIQLDPRRRGLRSAGGGARLSANRIAAIHVMPSAFNRHRFWHLGTPHGGRHAIYLPCHDVILAEQMAAAPDHQPRRAHAENDSPRILRALGDNSRLAIATLLAHETLSAAELGRRLSLSPPAVSHHLGEMRAAGLIDETRSGASRQLSLHRAAFANLGVRLLDFLDANPSPAAAMRSRRKSPRVDGGATSSAAGASRHQ